MSDGQTSESRDATDAGKNLEQRVRDVLKNPQNLGELSDADAVGTVGNSECGEMLRMWLKYKRDDGGREVVDKATFQSFGCETAIAVASLATEMIRGKTREEILAMKGDELAADLGPLPPMKIHCAELVEGALRSALDKKSAQPAEPGDPAVSSTKPPEGHLLANMTEAQREGQDIKIKFLD